MSEVWHGPDALRPFLVPITDLFPSDNNPRRGRVDILSGSLRRWGQVRPILVGKDARIIAGQHVRLAALDLGWSHIAAVENDFTDEAEARAYMIADNRTHDVGGYDQAALHEHLDALAKLDRLGGTGFDLADLDDMHERLEKQDEEARAPVAAPPPVELHELVLLYTSTALQQLAIWERIVNKERGTKARSDTYYAAMRIAANVLNS